MFSASDKLAVFLQDVRSKLCLYATRQRNLDEEFVLVARIERAEFDYEVQAVEHNAQFRSYFDRLRSSINDLAVFTNELVDFYKTHGPAYKLKDMRPWQDYPESARLIQVALRHIDEYSEYVHVAAVVVKMKRLDVSLPAFKRRNGNLAVLEALDLTAGALWCSRSALINELRRLEQLLETQTRGIAIDIDRTMLALNVESGSIEYFDSYVCPSDLFVKELVEKLRYVLMNYDGSVDMSAKSVGLIRQLAAAANIVALSRTEIRNAMRSRLNAEKSRST